MDPPQRAAACGCAETTCAPSLGLMAAPHAVGMRKVYYVGATYLIDDELADTMLAYSGALARNSTSEPVTFSAYTGEDGPLVSVAFLLGPASELLYETVTSPRPDPDNAGTVEF